MDDRGDVEEDEQGEGVEGFSILQGFYRMCSGYGKDVAVYVPLWRWAWLDTQHNISKYDHLLVPPFYLKHICVILQS